MWDNYLFSVILFSKRTKHPGQQFQMDKKLLLIEIKSKLIKISFQPSSKLWLSDDPRNWFFSQKRTIFVEFRKNIYSWTALGHQIKDPLASMSTTLNGLLYLTRKQLTCIDPNLPVHRKWVRMFVDNLLNWSLIG